ncbi:hypothetical protein D3C71_77020 [compost metagenome]
MSEVKPEAVHFVHPIHTQENAEYFVRGRPRLYCESDTHPQGEWDTSFLAVGREIPIEDLTHFSWLAPFKGDGDLMTVEEPNMRLLPYIAGLVFRIPSGQLVYAGLQYLDADERLRLRPSAENGPLFDELFEPEAKIQFEIKPETRDIHGNMVAEGFEFWGCDAGLHFTLNCPLLARWDMENLLVQSNNTTVAQAHTVHDLHLVGHGPWRDSFELVGFSLAMDEEFSQLPMSSDGDDWPDGRPAPEQD